MIQKSNKSENEKMTGYSLQNTNTQNQLINTHQIGRKKINGLTEPSNFDKKKKPRSKFDPQRDALLYNKYHK